MNGGKPASGNRHSVIEGERAPYRSMVLQPYENGVRELTPTDDESAVAQFHQTLRHSHVLQTLIGS